MAPEESCDKQKGSLLPSEAGLRATSPVSLRSDIPASSQGQLQVFLSWRLSGANPHSSKRPPQVCLTPRGQRTIAWKAPASHPLQVPSGEPEFLGRALWWLGPQLLAAGRPGWESQLGDLGQINSLQLNFCIWKMKVTVPTLKEECPRG